MPHPGAILFGALFRGVGITIGTAIGARVLQMLAIRKANADRARFLHERELMQLFLQDRAEESPAMVQEISTIMVCPALS
jgi:hypothetical protein